MNIDWDFELGNLQPDLMVDKFTEIKLMQHYEKDPPWISMLNICDEAIVLSSKVSRKGVYFNLWKKASMLPIEQKSHQLKKDFGQSPFYQSVASCLKNNI